MLTEPLGGEEGPGKEGGGERIATSLVGGVSFATESDMMKRTSTNGKIEFEGKHSCPPIPAGASLAVYG